MKEIQTLQLFCAVLILIIIALCAVLSIATDKNIKHRNHANTLASHLSNLLLHELRYIHNSENVSRARQALLKYEDETDYNA